MKTLTRLAALIAALAAQPLAAYPTDVAAVSGEAAEQVRPEPPPQLTSISFSGNGCPQGHAPKIDVGGNEVDGLRFRFDNTFRAVSPGTKRTVNCQGHLNAEGIGAGWQMAVSEVVVTGKGTLQPGAAMRYFTTLYYSQSPADTVTVDGELKNNQDGTVRDVPVTIHAKAGSNTVWGPCTSENGSPGILNVNFRVALPSDTQNSFEVETERWAFQWRRCA